VQWDITYDADGVTELSRAAGAKDVAISGFALTGAAAGNYRIEQPEGLTATITPATITVSGITAADKVYDGTSEATVDAGSATLAGLVSGDDVAVAVTGEFADVNAGSQTVTLTTVVSGLDLDNYEVTPQATTTAEITKRDLVISGITVADREYDGTTDATVDFSGVTEAVLIAGGLVVREVPGTDGNGNAILTQVADDVSISGVTAAFRDANVGGGKPVDLTITAAGNELANYTIIGDAVTATISPKVLSIADVTIDDKSYDGTTNATVNLGSASLAGLVGSETVTVSATGSFSSKDVTLGPDL
jgi:hypothetical protein